jgi:hypothetical protein
MTIPAWATPDLSIHQQLQTIDMDYQNTIGKFSGLKMAIIALTLFFTSCEKESIEQNCKTVEIKGKLTHNESVNTYQYKTSGGWVVDISFTDKITFSHPNYPGNGLELSSAPGGSFTTAREEIFNGTHIKNRHGSRRSIILPDGAKVTIAANSEEGDLSWVSIYEGNESHRINVICGVDHSSLDYEEAQQFDNSEADGETGTLSLTIIFIQFINLYSEKTLTDKIMYREQLAQAKFATPSEVTDYYDDPRLPNT